MATCTARSHYGSAGVCRLGAIGRNVMKKFMTSAARSRCRRPMTSWVLFAEACCGRCLGLPGDVMVALQSLTWGSRDVRLLVTSWWGLGSRDGHDSGPSVSFFARDARQIETVKVSRVSAGTGSLRVTQTSP